MIRPALLAALLAAPAAAQTVAPPVPAAAPRVLVTPSSVAPEITVTASIPGITAAQRRVPALLSPAERAAWRAVFLDIGRERFTAAEAALAALPPGLLHPTARAQIMLGRGAAGASLTEVSAWVAANPQLPQAERLAALARQLGAAETALLPAMKPLRPVNYGGGAIAPRPARGEAARDADAIARLKPLLAADRNADAQALYEALAPDLSEPVRTEWAQRLAWSWYGAGDNGTALTMARRAAAGSGEWAALGGWVAGLAATRLGDCASAAQGFDTVGQRYADNDLMAAAAFWASRAHLACGRPENVTPRLEKAARYGHSFYGLLARRTLGLAPVDNAVWTEPDFIQADWTTLSQLGGARRAAALVEIGQLGLADRELRHLAAIGDATTYAPLLRLAGRLDLPATQYWLAHHPPPGQDAPLSARFPAPDWRPFRGWRVDRGLVFAHALQESRFITTATSRAGAKGVMQLMPGTATLVTRDLPANPDGTPAAVPDLAEPAFNIELGQTYLEALRDMSYTGGLLPKVVAAYNAGPGSVQKWNASLDDKGDPLLFIESIPFKETRHYVEIVLRNFWMYQLRDGDPVHSLDALAGGLWPRFPGMPGATGVRAAPRPPAPPPTTMPLPVAVLPGAG